MDAQKFDELTKAMGRPVSRRSALKVLLALAGSALGVEAAPRPAHASGVPDKLGNAIHGGGSGSLGNELHPGQGTAPPCPSDYLPCGRECIYCPGGNLTPSCTCCQGSVCPGAPGDCCNGNQMCLHGKCCNAEGADCHGNGDCCFGVCASSDVGRPFDKPAHICCGTGTICDAGPPSLPQCCPPGQQKCCTGTSADGFPVSSCCPDGSDCRPDGSCCSPAGPAGTCTTQNDCCSPGICSGGKCCLNSSQPCSDDGQCCNGACLLMEGLPLKVCCATGGEGPCQGFQTTPCCPGFTCNPDTNTCCIFPTGPTACKSAFDCCPPYVCGPGKTCCLPLGQACSTAVDWQCCEGVCNGTCCIPGGATAKRVEDCCSGVFSHGNTCCDVSSACTDSNGSKVCCPPNTDCGGPSGCCTPAGKTCSSTHPCCPGTSCDAATGTCLSACGTCQTQQGNTCVSCQAAGLCCNSGGACVPASECTGGCCDSSGVCGCGLGPGLNCCGGQCVDTTATATACGSSCTDCTAQGTGMTCMNSQCVCASTGQPPGPNGCTNSLGGFCNQTSDCSGLGLGVQCCNHKCVDTQYDANNCNTCGHVCPRDQYGQLGCCSGSCVNTSHNVGTFCGSGEPPNGCQFCEGATYCRNSSCTSCTDLDGQCTSDDQCCSDFCYSATGTCQASSQPNGFPCVANKECQSGVCTGAADCSSPNAGCTCGSCLASGSPCTSANDYQCCSTTCLSSGTCL